MGGSLGGVKYRAPMVLITTVLIMIIIIIIIIMTTTTIIIIKQAKICKEKLGRPE